MKQNKRILLMSFLFLCILGALQSVAFTTYTYAQDVSSTQIQDVSTNLNISTLEAEQLVEDSNVIKAGIELTSSDVVVDETFLSSMNIDTETINYLISIDTNITEADYSEMDKLDSLGAVELDAASARVSGNTLTLKLTGKDVRNIVNGGYVAGGIFALIGAFTGGAGWAVAAVILGVVSSVASNTLSYKYGVSVKIPKPTVSRKITIYANGKSYTRRY